MSGPRRTPAVGRRAIAVGLGLGLAAGVAADARPSAVPVLAAVGRAPTAPGVDPPSSIAAADRGGPAPGVDPYSNIAAADHGGPGPGVDPHSNIAAADHGGPGPGVDPYSNIAAADYVGPAACGECHADKHASWRAGLHAAMNRPAGQPGAVRGDFSGLSLDYDGGRARFERDANGPLMTLTRRGEAARRYRITRTIGARALQEYVGVALDRPPGEGGVEIRLPFGYALATGRWLPQPYFDSWFGPEYGGDGRATFDAFRPDEAPWATRCAWCHNTYPFELRALRETARAVGHGFEQYVSLSGPIARSTAADAVRRDNLLPVDALVTVGISCESCHLGGREHAVGGEAIRFVPTSPALGRRPEAPDLRGGRRSATVVNTICGQCHSTPTPRYPGGAAVRNSSEALDLVAGGCAPAIACTGCHDPHVTGPGAGAPDQPRHLQACAGCHPALASAAAAVAHGRHRATDASCLDCHMPRIVQGISRFVRSHRISSPSDPPTLTLAAPGACNLCHLDRSIRWTLDQLERGWGRQIALDRSWGAGEPEAPIGPQWLRAGGPVRLAAAAAYARSPLGRAALPALAAIVDQPVAHDRMRLLFALEEVLGRRLRRGEYDPVAPPDRRARQAARLRARWPDR